MNEDNTVRVKEWLERGETYFLNKKYDDAITAYTQALSIDRTNTDAYFIRGVIYQTIKRYDLAISDYSNVIEIKNNHNLAYYYRGEVYRDLNKYDRAIEDYNKAIAINPKYANAYKKRAIAYFCTNRYERTIEDYSAASAIDPNDAWVYRQRGHAYMVIGNYKKAIEDSSIALSMAPDDVDAISNRGIAYAFSGEKEKAIPDLKKACDMGDKAACEILNKIDNIQFNKKTLICLKEIDPFNIPPVDNQQAAMFTKHLTGTETFEFDATQKPKSVLFYDLKYNYPRHSYAHGWLLSIDIDTLSDICNSGEVSTMEPILKTYIVGAIHIEYGGNLAGIRLEANKLSL